MILQAILTGVLTLSADPAEAGANRDLLAIRVGRAETISHGTLEHAVILVENGKIVAVGEDLPIERGIRVIERPNWVATPGLVNCHTRIGLDGRGGTGSEPMLRASAELYAGSDVWEDVLEVGVTTLGIYPLGGGIPGQAVAVKPEGKSAAGMILADSVYLKVRLASTASSKKMLRDGFEKVDEYEEKVAKAREKWEKDQEKAKKKKKSKKDDDDKKDDDKKEDGNGDDKKKEDEVPKYFVPPTPDEKVVPFIALRAKELSALVDLRKSSDYLHLRDVIDDEEVDWSLFLGLGDNRRRDTDFFEITERVGEAGIRVTMASRINLQPFTRRERNLPAEFQRAGAKLALLPTSDSVDGFKGWREAVGHLVAAGLDRQAALAGMTLEPAHVLGLGERLGSLDVGKDANIILWDGDPFEPQTRIQAVMLEGRIVEGEVR